MTSKEQEELIAIHEEIVRWEQNDTEGYDIAIDLLSTIKYTIEFLLAEHPTMQGKVADDTFQRN